MVIEVIKVYDDKGHTVLKKKILKHLRVRGNDFLVAELREDGTVILRPLKKEEILSRLRKPEEEDKALKEKTKIKYDIS